jgi:hypothetical protein
MRAIAVPAERIANARSALDSIRTLLLTPTPQALSACGEPLSEAAESLRRLKRVDPGCEAISSLNRDLDEVRSLLQQAGAFYLGLASVLNSMTGTYDAVGDLHAPAGATVSVEG